MSNNTEKIIKVQNTVIYQWLKTFNEPYMPIQHSVSIEKDWLITYYLGQIKDNKYHGQCICRISHLYDQRQNRQYYFDNSLYENGGIKNDKNCRSIVFYGKSLLKKASKSKKFDGTADNYTYGIDQVPKQKKMLIIEEPTLEKQENQEQSPDTWTKYDQVFYKKDIQILKSTSWLSSNILDAYAFKLNKENVEQFVQSENPNLFNRFFCIPSYVYTQTISEQTREYQKVDCLKTLLLEVSLIKNLFFEIYQTVVIIINQNNAHWFCIEIQYKIDQKVLSFTIYDSMSGHKKKYLNYCKNIRQLLIDSYLCDSDVVNVELDNITVEQVHQQGNGYACGDHTYDNIRKIYKRSQGQDIDFKDGSNIKNVRKQLLEIIKF